MVTGNTEYVCPSVIVVGGFFAQDFRVKNSGSYVRNEAQIGPEDVATVADRQQGINEK